MDGQDDSMQATINNGVPGVGPVPPQQFHQQGPRFILPATPDPVLMQLVTVMQQQQQQLAQQIQEQHQQMRQQQQNMAQQQESITAIVRQQQQFMETVAANNGQIPFHPERILDSLANNIKEFRYDPESSVTFAVWFSRYDDLFEKDAARLDEKAKIRLLLRKLGMEEHERYTSFILPQVSKDFSFSKTVDTLKSLFGAQESLVSRRYRCLQITKQPTEDHVSYACRVNKFCVEFDLKKLSEDEFKSLIYVLGLKSESDAEIRTRLLTKIEEQPEVTLQQVSEECQRLLNLKHDTAMIESHSMEVNKVQQQRFNRQWEKKKDRSPSPSAQNGIKRRAKKPCWLCGSMHFREDCDYLDHRCAECDKIGHREGYCSSAKFCQQWDGRRTGTESNQVVASNVVATESAVRKGRKFVPVELNGIPAKLQLDTASDITVISKQLWKKLGKPKLSAPSVGVQTATGTELSLAGEFCCDVTVVGMTQCEMIRVTEKPIQLLGLDLLDSFGLGSVPADCYCCNMLRSYQVPADRKSTVSRMIVEQKPKEGTAKTVIVNSRKNRPGATRAPPSTEKLFERGKFAKNDFVYARVRFGKVLKWSPGVVLEKIGCNKFNVLVNDMRLEFCDVSQLRSRL
uniref:Uncharacterized protein K02A2.6 n=3 Tax=Culex pipiens TaxID=7175 RepID=A0A8D8CLC5_CULPI